MLRYWHSPSDIIVLPETLWDFAWSAPTRDLATKLDLSDVGLKKMLTSHGVTTPPQGHWNRVHAGKAVIGRPKLPPRQPGGSGRLRLDARFAAVLPSAPSIPVDGPFASAAVPEDLEELRAIELKALGRVATPTTLNRYAPGLQSIMRSEARRREKTAGSPYHWDLPKFDNAVAKRRLRILNAIFLALAKRGHGGSADEREGEIHARAIVGDTYVSLDLSIAGKHRTVKRAGYDRADPDLPLSTPLILRVDGSSNNQAAEVWQDDATGKLEARIAAITAGIIVVGEAKFRRGLWRECVRLRRRRRFAVPRRGRLPGCARFQLLR